MITLYEFSTERNKFQIKGKTAGSLKTQLIKTKGYYCYVCGKEFSKGRLQLEHKIPVMVGGHLFDETNVELICPLCHIKKTILDRKIIRILKDLKIISGKYIIHSAYPIEEIKSFYKQFLEIYKKNCLSEEEQMKGKMNIDYLHKWQEDNRTIKQEEKEDGTNK